MRTSTIIMVISILGMPTSSCSSKSKPKLPAVGAPDTANSQDGEYTAPPLSNGYESLTACEKQATLWQRIRASTYHPGRRPDLKRPDVWGLILGSLRKKMDWVSDQAPEAWAKPIHRHASVAAVRFDPTGTPGLTSLF